MRKNKKPILQAKLQKIEQHSEVICVFHCSGVRPPQWRHLKNVLSNKGHTFWKPGVGPRREGLVSSTQLTKSPPGPFCFLYSSTRAGIPSPYGLTGASYNTEWNFHQLGGGVNPWAELLGKIVDCESNTNLVFLYAKMNSTVINHMDIQKAMQLDTKTVLAQFWRSIHESSQRFRDCFLQATIEFIQYQARRSRLEHGWSSQKSRSLSLGPSGAVRRQPASS